MNVIVWLLFLLTIPVANLLIGHVGTTCVPAGPCLIPVWPGILAPSGVLLIGVALVVRDIIHERDGAQAVVALIFVGSLLSALVAPPALVLASAAAFLLSELADMAVYSPLRRRNLLWAVALSGVVGAFVDSAAFLLIAFGSLEYMQGQVLGKMIALFVAIPLIGIRRRAAE